MHEQLPEIGPNSHHWAEQGRKYINSKQLQDAQIAKDWEILAHPIDEHGGVQSFVPGSLSASEAYPDEKDRDIWTVESNSAQTYVEDYGDPHVRGDK